MEMIKVNHLRTPKQSAILALVIALFLSSFSTAYGANSSSITRLKITKNTVVTASGQALDTPPEVAVADSSNNTVRDRGNTITASIISGSGGSLRNNTAQTGSNGVAKFDDMTITGTGGVTYTIQYSYKTFTVNENVTIPLLAGLNPTFGTYTRTADGFTVAISNYNNSYSWSGTATNGGTVSISDSGLATISGLTPGTASVATITTARSGYNNGSSSTSSTSALNAALTPAFGTYTQTASGFTVQITNYSSSYTWGRSATNGASVSISNSGLVTVSGLAAGASSVATITTTRSGYVGGSAATVSTAALLGALTPSFGTYTPTSDGFTVAITNYDTAYTWAGTATRSGTVAITGTNGNGLATITGVAANTASVATITTTRSGYSSGSAATSSTTSLRAGLASTTGSVTSNFGGFTFTITNYNSAYTYGFAVTAGTASAGTATGSNLPVTVSGLNDGQNSTVSITTTRSGYADSTVTKTGNSKISALTPTTGDPGAWTSSAISDDGKYVLFAGTNSKLFISPDNGDNWSEAASSKLWTAVAVSGNGSKMIAAGTKSKIYYSSDYGSTWSSKGATRNWRAVAINSDGSKMYAAVQNGFIYRSTNSGSTWTQLGLSKNWRAIATSQNGNIVLAAAFGGNLYTSTNGGTTWTARELVRNWSTVSISDDGSVMTAAVGNGFIYISYDSGETWNQITGTERENWNSVACDATCRNVAITTVSGIFFVATMAGQTMAGITNPNFSKKWSTVTFDSAGSQVIVGASSGMIWRSMDTLATWSHRTRIQE